jgi:ABC-type phosphate transport system substrate-binding protein
MRAIWKLTYTLLLGVASSAVASAADQITVAGSTTVKPIVDTAVLQFKKNNPGVEFVVGAGGSGQGIQLIGKGSVSIGMSSRPVSAAEKAQAGDMVEYPVGMDGVALIANSSNPVTKLTKEQVQAIYSGQVTSWKDLGGSAAPIVPFTLNSKHGTHEVWAEYFRIGNQRERGGRSLGRGAPQEGRPLVFGGHGQSARRSTPGARGCPDQSERNRVCFGWDSRRRCPKRGARAPSGLGRSRGHRGQREVRGV